MQPIVKEARLYGDEDFLSRGIRQSHRQPSRVLPADFCFPEIPKKPLRFLLTFQAILPDYLQVCFSDRHFLQSSQTCTTQMYSLLLYALDSVRKRKHGLNHNILQDQKGYVLSYPYLSVYSSIHAIYTGLHEPDLTCFVQIRPWHNSPPKY